jgi:DNA-binding response OmpR family regulator
MIYRFGECTVDTAIRSVQRGGHRLRLRPKVFRVCCYLLKHHDWTILLSPTFLPTP